MKQTNLIKVQSAIKGDIKNGAKHMDILKALTFGASIDTKEVEAIIKAYEDAYAEYKISSHNIYKNYYNRVLVTGSAWVKHFITQEGLSKTTCTREDLLGKVLFTAKKLAVKKIAYYKRTLKDVVKDEDNKISYLNNLLEAGLNALLVDIEDKIVVTDVIVSMIESLESAKKVKTDDDGSSVVDDGSSVVDDGSSVVDDDGSSVVDCLADTNEARIDYIIEKLTILNKKQLDEVVSLIDSF